MDTRSAESWQHPTMPDTPTRPLPAITPWNEHFWHGGEDGLLQLNRCNDCAAWLHPPKPACTACGSMAIGIGAVSGLATLATFTVNHQQWFPGFDPPYVIAIVELDDDPTIRLTTNIVNCPIDEVEIGMPVQVTFEQHDDVWIPLFEPRKDS